MFGNVRYLGCSAADRYQYLLGAQELRINKTTSHQSSNSCAEHLISRCVGRCDFLLGLGPGIRVQPVCEEKTWDDVANWGQGMLVVNMRSIFAISWLPCWMGNVDFHPSSGGAVCVALPAFIKFHPSPFFGVYLRFLVRTQQYEVR